MTGHPLKGYFFEGSFCEKICSSPQFLQLRYKVLFPPGTSIWFENLVCRGSWFENWRCRGS